jgi:hypothetical protein
MCVAVATGSGCVRVTDGHVAGLRSTGQPPLSAGNSAFVIYAGAQAQAASLQSTPVLMSMAAAVVGQCTSLAYRAVMYAGGHALRPLAFGQRHR